MWPLTVGGGGAGVFTIEIMFLFPGDGLMTGRAHKWGEGYKQQFKELRTGLYDMCLYGSPGFIVFIILTLR